MSYFSVFYVFQKLTAFTLCTAADLYCPKRGRGGLMSKIHLALIWHGLKIFSHCQNFQIHWKKSSFKLYKAFPRAPKNGCFDFFQIFRCASANKVDINQVSQKVSSLLRRRLLISTTSSGVNFEHIAAMWSKKRRNVKIANQFRKHREAAKYNRKYLLEKKEKVSPRASPRYPDQIGQEEELPPCCRAAKEYIRTRTWQEHGLQSDRVRLVGIPHLARVSVKHSHQFDKLITAELIL